MADGLRCYRCGASLDDMSLPISRRDECPSCAVYLHVCKMCEFYDPRVPGQCREDDADDVLEKDKVNFCEWFKPGFDVFDPLRAKEEAEARDALAVLFGDAEQSASDQDEARSEADKLFK